MRQHNLFISRKGMKSLRFFAHMTILAFAVFLPAAQAQEDVQARSVSSRARPGYTAQPLRLGKFDLLPSINVDTEYNDNILFATTNEIDDVIISARPSLNILNLRPDREIRVQLSGEYDAYIDRPSEDRSNIRAAVNTRFGLGTARQYSASFSINQSNERRQDIDTISSSPEPIRFTSYNSQLGVQQTFGALNLGVRGQFRALTYAGSLPINGQIVDLSFRNFQNYSLITRLGYARGRLNSYYVEVNLDDRNYNFLDNDPDLPFGFTVDRSSRGVRVEAGISRKLSELLFLDVRAGYLYRDFSDPAISNTTGLAFSGDLLWNVTSLTSIEISTSRRVDESINPNFTNIVRTEFSGRVDHELMRNLIVSTRGRFSNFNRGAGSALRDWEAGVSARYLINENVALTADAVHLERTGGGSLVQNRVFLGIEFAL